MTRAAARRLARGSAGFTLIEVMAVVVILALIAGTLIQRFAAVAGQAASDDAKELAAALDFTREKAVAVGRAHRLVLDLDGAQYWIEAQPAPESPTPLLAWSELDELPLRAPRADARRFAPLPGARPKRTRANVRIAGFESDAGAASEGVVAIPFAPDGATDPARIWLAAGDVRVVVDVAALADPTRVAFDDAPQ